MKIPVFYSPRMVPGVKLPSPSANKPAQVLATWQAAGLVDVFDPAPAQRVHLKTAHAARYVDDVLCGFRKNGFGTKGIEVAYSLPYTVGAMIEAAVYARDTAGVACAPVSGFHHAGYANGGGFCTFNGLVVAAMELLRTGTKGVWILDCDQHYGNGTDDCLGKIMIRRGPHVDRYKRNGATSDCVIHSFDHATWAAYKDQKYSKRVFHFSAGAGYREASDAEPFLNAVLPALLAQIPSGDVLLYQAGADPHVNDPLGGWMTTKQLQRRDRIVFDACKAQGVPVAWNLAGGYQEEADGSIPKVLEIHHNTMVECSTVFGG